jgi:AraC-like DNA-binding protein
MSYWEIKPGNRLKYYVKCFYAYEADNDLLFSDTVFSSGCMELIFNLGDGSWQVSTRSIGRNTMLGIRFYPHAAACFLQQPADEFNDRVVDFEELSGKTAKGLRERLQNTTGWTERISLIEDFLWRQLTLSEKKHDKVALLANIMQELQEEDFFDNINNLAARYGFTARYLQKLFLQYTGLTPKLFSKIHRFQNSLRLVTGNNTSLTSIAYDCGYFDQSHFIREFKSFTGCTPSGYVGRQAIFSTDAAQV